MLEGFFLLRQIVYVSYVLYGMVVSIKEQSMRWVMAVRCAGFVEFSVSQAY